jgi:hypothetical protein
MNNGNHPINLNGGSIIDSGALFATTINLNGGSIGSGPLGSAGGIQVNSGAPTLAHFSANFISGNGSVDGSAGPGGNGLTLAGGISATGGTMTLSGNVKPNAITVTQTGIVDMGEDLLGNTLQSLFGGTGSSTTPGNFGTLNLDGFTVLLAGVPLSTGFYKNPTNDTVVDIVNTTAAVPTPATLPLFASGLAGLVWLSRSRKRSN